MTNKDTKKETAALVLLQNNRSWESIHACIELGIFAHIDWSNRGSLIVKLAEKVQERCRQDRKAAALFWEALRSNDVSADLMIGKVPLWMQFLFHNGIHVFKAMVEKNDVSSPDLNLLPNSRTFQFLVLQEGEWGVMAQIATPLFAPIKQWAEEYRKDNLWMLSTSLRGLYQTRPDFAENGMPVTEIERWAVAWAKNSHTTSAGHMPISPVAFYAEGKTSSAKVRLVDQLDHAARKNVIEHLTAENWKILSNMPSMNDAEWLNGADYELSFPALRTAFAAWNNTLKMSAYDKENFQPFMRLYLKRATKHFLKINTDHQQEMFENLLSLWDSTNMQLEESQAVADLMKNNSEIAHPWTWPNTNASHIALAVGAFVDNATDAEIETHSRDLCEFVLRALKGGHNEKVSSILTHSMFEALKKREADSLARPHLAQILWMSTFMSPSKVLVQRCSRWSGLRKAEEHRANLKVFYPPVHQDLMDAVFSKINLKALKPEGRSVVEKTCLEYNVSDIVKAPTVKSTRKM